MHDQEILNNRQKNLQPTNPVPHRPHQYYRKFVPTEEMGCKCGAPVRMREHIIQECRLHAHHRLTLGHSVDVVIVHPMQAEDGHPLEPRICQHHPIPFPQVPTPFCSTHTIFLSYIPNFLSFWLIPLYSKLPTFFYYISYPLPYSLMSIIWHIPFRTNSPFNTISGLSRSQTRHSQIR